MQEESQEETRFLGMGNWELGMAKGFGFLPGEYFYKYGMLPKKPAFLSRQVIIKSQTRLIYYPEKNKSLTVNLLTQLTHLFIQQKVIPNSQFPIP